MKNYLAIVLDWTEKFSKRVKNLMFLILIGMLVFFLITGKIGRNQAIQSAKEAVERISGLNLEKDILFNQKEIFRSERDSIREENFRIKEERDLALEQKEQAEWRSDRDKREKNDALRALRLVSSDSSHIFNQTVAYPFSGKKEYGYNAKQVSGIHKTFIENEFNKDIIDDQKAAIDHCNDALASSKELEMSHDEVSKSYEEEIEVDSSIMAIDEEITDIVMDEWKKDRRKERWGKVLGVFEKIGYAVGGFFLGSITAK